MVHVTYKYLNKEDQNFEMEGKSAEIDYLLDFIKTGFDVNQNLTKVEIWTGQSHLFFNRRGKINISGYFVEEINEDFPK